MSRSYRKTPKAGITTAKSDHAWKKKAARRLRRRVKQDLQNSSDGDRFADKRWDVVDPWGAPKDGKFWFGDDDDRLRRK